MGKNVSARTPKGKPEYRLRSDVRAIDLALDPFEQPGQNAAGADLIELVESVRQQAADRLFPKNRRNHLPDQEFADFLRLRVWAGIHVRPDWDSRRLEVNRPEGFRQLLVGRLHQVS